MAIPSFYGAVCTGGLTLEWKSRLEEGQGLLPLSKGFTELPIEVLGLEICFILKMLVSGTSAPCGMPSCGSLFGNRRRGPKPTNIWPIFSPFKIGPFVNPSASDIFESFCLGNQSHFKDAMASKFIFILVIDHSCYCSFQLGLEFGGWFGLNKELRNSEGIRLRNGRKPLETKQ